MTTKKDYSKGKVYKIEPMCEHEEGEIYIGSTTKQYLSQRMMTHKNDYKRWKCGKKHNVRSFNLFDKYGFENCKIILLETVEAKSLEELHARERFYILNLKCVNKIIPLRTIEEWHVDNQEKICQKTKLYRTQNKETIAELNRMWYQSNKEKITELHKKYRENNKESIREKNKEYRQENKEIISKRSKEFWEKNKEVMKQQASIRFVCDCGSNCRYDTKSKHFKTLKHMAFINNTKPT
jgi:hypothetical protein